MDQQQYELRTFDEGGSEIGTFFITKKTDGAAKAHAGRLAKQNNGPVDLARAGAADWNDRYLTTAAPSEFHSTGVRFERLVP